MCILTTTTTTCREKLSSKNTYSYNTFTLLRVLNPKQTFIKYKTNLYIQYFLVSWRI